MIPLPGKLERNAPAGTEVALWTKDHHSIAAYGILADRSLKTVGSFKLLKQSHTIVQVTKVVKPASLLSTHKKASLASFGSTPFHVICQWRHLQLHSNDNSPSVQVHGVEVNQLSASQLKEYENIETVFPGHFNLDLSEGTKPSSSVDDLVPGEEFLGEFKRDSESIRDGNCESWVRIRSFQASSGFSGSQGQWSRLRVTCSAERWGRDSLSNVVACHQWPVSGPATVTARTLARRASATPARPQPSAHLMPAPITKRSGPDHGPLCQRTCTSATILPPASTSSRQLNRHSVYPICSSDSVRLWPPGPHRDHRLPPV